MPDSELGTGPRVIAVGGGKGGVGRSLVASGLAVFVAQLGKKVLLVDAAPHGPTLAGVFRVARADGGAPPWAPPAPDPRGSETIVPSLRLRTASSERGPRVDLAVRRPRELARAAGADVCVVDLGAGVATRDLDALLDADAMIAVTTPEPIAVEALYRLVRHAFARRLARKLREHPAALAALRGAVRASAGPPMPVTLAEAVAGAVRDKDAVADVAWGELARFRVRIVVNQSRSRADLDLGDAIVRVTHRRMGIAVDYLGHVEFDDAVFLAARQRRPLLVEAPAAKASRNLERIARRLLSLEAVRLVASGPGAGAPGPPAQPTHYDVLALDRGASDEEIRRAYRKTREIYSPESLAVAGLLTEEEVSRMVARIEEARDVLLDPSRRRPYDLSITPADELFPAFDALEELPDDVIAASLVPEPVITPDTEFSGVLLRAIREARGVELRDVAARTKISLQHLRALEDEDFGALPAAVYTRGFVTEVAKFLRLDVDQVVRTYLRRYRKATER